MTLYRYRDAIQFLADRYTDYGKFFKPSLAEDDSGLLVAILERLSGVNNERCGDENELTESIRIDEINPVRLASAHVQVKNLTGYEYNIFEAAFFSGTEKDKQLRVLNFIQIFCSMFCTLFFFIVVLSETIQVWAYSNPWKPESKESDEGTQNEYFAFVQIVLINIFSLAYFWNIIGKSRQGYRVFNVAMDILCVDPVDGIEVDKYYVKPATYRSLCQLFNFANNNILGWGLYILNIFFIQSAKTPLDAILNSVATAFILEIDDSIRPYKRLGKGDYWFDWELDSIPGKVLELVKEYVHSERSNEQVRVTKVFGDSLKFHESDVCSFSLRRQTDAGTDDCSGTITILIYTIDGTNNEVQYQVEGDGASTFLENLAEFECMEEEENRNGDTEKERKSCCLRLQTA